MRFCHPFRKTRHLDVGLSNCALGATASSAAKHEAYTISNLIPQLRPEFQLQFAESVKVGPYTVPLVDESNKVAILIVSWVV